MVDLDIRYEWTRKWGVITCAYEYTDDEVDGQITILWDMGSVVVNSVRSKTKPLPPHKSEPVLRKEMVTFDFSFILILEAENTNTTTSSVLPTLILRNTLWNPDSKEYMEVSQPPI